MSSTLAKEFINRKLQEYNEPVRKGKPKGEAVGLSNRKYTAALVMAIYAMNTQEVEEIIGTKRSLISKWQTEPRFQQQMEAMRSEFCAAVQKSIINNHDEGKFRDASYYSDKIKKMFVLLCDDAAIRDDGDFLLSAWRLLREAEVC